MAKKLGKIILFAAVAGAAAAGISYLARYKSFNKELDEDFHDFEDDDDDEIPDSTMSRSYVALHADKDELLVAAGDMLGAAKDVAAAAKNVVKDAAAILTDNAQEAVSVASDSFDNAKAKAEVKKTEENAETISAEDKETAASDEPSTDPLDTDGDVKE